MLTETLQPKKKLIDLKGDTFKALSIMAVQRGTNLKKLIEAILDKVAADYDDVFLYEYLSKTEPDGKLSITGKEKADFESWLGV